MQKIAFIDRDGLLIFEPTETFQIDDLSQYKILPNVVTGLKQIQNAGYKLVMITNQDGLGTSKYPIANFETIQQKLLQDLASEDIVFEQNLICPHFEKDNCQCRKPKTGLIKNIQYDPKYSFVIGDRESDLKLADNLGLIGIKTITNQGFPRVAGITRTTKETNIKLLINLDGTGKYKISTGLSFFDHMLEQIALHSKIDILLEAEGDLQVDEHHLVEDVGICLGKAISDAAKQYGPIQRYGFLLPMDECLCETAIDFCGRPTLVFNAKFKREKVGDLPTELVKEFFKSLTNNLNCALHINLKYGENDHHKIEAIFKSFARSLRGAVQKESNNYLPSTKGII